MFKINNTALKIFTRFVVPIAIGLTVGQLGKVMGNDEIIKPFITISTLILDVIKLISPYFLAVLIIVGLASLKENKFKFLVRFTSIIFITLLILGFLTYFMAYFVTPFIHFRVVDKAPVLEYFKLKDFPILSEMIVGKFSFTLFGQQIALTYEIIAIFFGVLIGTLINPDGKFFELIMKIQNFFFWFFSKIIVPVIPFFIMGTFAQNTYRSAGIAFLSTDIFLTIFVVFSQFAWLYLMYYIVCRFTKYNFKAMCKAGTQIYGFLFTVGGNSNGPVIPYIFEKGKELKLNLNKMKFVTTTSFNMPGSLISIVIIMIFVMNSYAVEYSFASIFQFLVMIIFILMVAPGVPGGVIGLITPLLISTFGFTPEMVSMFTSLYYNQGTSNAGTNNAADLYLTPLL